MSEFTEPQIAYKCDLCGELFNSSNDALSHSQEAHPEPRLTDGSESSVTGTSTPAEDREEKRARGKSQLDKELQTWEVESTKDGQDSLGN